MVQVAEGKLGISREVVEDAEEVAVQIGDGELMQFPRIDSINQLGNALPMVRSNDVSCGEVHSFRAMVTLAPRSETSSTSKRYVMPL